MRGAGSSSILPRLRSHADVPWVIGIILLAVIYALDTTWRRTASNAGIPNYDTYAYFYPNIRYALDSIARGWGLLWNPFQNCGQPFFANPQVALLYPLNAIYLFVDFKSGLVLSFAAHLAVAGIGVYALARIIGTSSAAGLCGAAVFQLGTLTLWLGYWFPIGIATYAWMPAALAACEYILRSPSRRAALLMGMFLTLALLGGHVQWLVYIYQLVVLRVAWELITQPAHCRPAVLRNIALALLVPVLLGAVQLLPAAELVQYSIRHRALRAHEVRLPALTMTWTSFRASLGQHVFYGAIFAAVTWGLISLVHATRLRRIASFYVLVGGLYFALAFDNPLSHLYAALPFTAHLREPQRFLFVTAFAGCIAAACGADALTQRQEHRQSVGLYAAPLITAAALYVISPTGLRPADAVALLSVLLLVLARSHRRAGLLLAVIVPALLIAEQRRGETHLFGFARDEHELFASSEVFGWLRGRRTVQNRAYLVHPRGLFIRDWSLVPKAAMMQRSAAINDYEPLTSQRYAELWLRMKYDVPYKSLNLFIYDLKRLPANQPLFNLLAARFILADRADERFVWRRGDLGLRLAWAEGTKLGYENRAALPRAFFVPSVTVVTDPSALLERLASPDHDPRATALVEADVGHASAAHRDGIGTVIFEKDAAEEIILQVTATAAGFVFVSDQYYPGWYASVNDEPVPIWRANFAFRLIAVPAGVSTVVFRYRPPSVLIGAMVSALSLCAWVVLFVRAQQSAGIANRGIARWQAWRGLLQLICCVRQRGQRSAQHSRDSTLLATSRPRERRDSS